MGVNAEQRATIENGVTDCKKGVASFQSSHPGVTETILTDIPESGFQQSGPR
jgi:hypothetical protein